MNLVCMQVRNTDEVALKRELLEARDSAHRAEEKAARALKAKVGSVPSCDSYHV